MITVVGSLLMDLAIDVPELVRPGTVAHGRHLQIACGGRGANQASAVARLGGHAALIGVVGADLFGAAMLSALAAEGVDTRAVLRRAGEASGCFLLATDPHGQTEILVANGINGSLCAADITPHAALLRASRAVIAQLETSFEAVDAALRIAREAGVLTVLNPAPVFRSQDVLFAWSDIVVANEQEAASLSGVEVRDIESAAEAARAIRDKGAGDILVTLGAAGVWVEARTWQGHIPGYSVDVVDELGAGDTFVGAFVTRLCEGADMHAAATFATAAAAMSVTRRGAQPSIPRRNEVEAFIAEGG